MQTMPGFVYLIPAVAFFGIGVVPGVFASVIFALPPTVRMTNLEFVKFQLNWSKRQILWFNTKTKAL